VYVGPSNGGNVGQATTGADGSYSLTAAPGEYRLFVAGPAGRPGLPETWRLTSIDLFELRGDLTRDVSLPASATVTVRVLGADDQPVVGARIDLPLYGVQPVDFGGWIGGVSSGSAAGDLFTGLTDGNGEYRFRVFDGSSSGSPGTVTPPAGSGYRAQTVRAPVADGDTTLVVRFTPLDSVAPTVRCDPPSIGWHTAEVSVNCTASDAGSGLADPGDASFSLSTSVGDGHEDAAANTDTHQVCDRADTCATAGPIGPISVDRAAPAITYSQANDGANGWWVHSPASVHVTVTDLNIGNTLTCSIDGVIVRRLPLRSGPTTREADLTVRGEGRHTVSCTAADTLGHSGTTTAQVLVDLKVPRAPLLAADRTADYSGNGGWFADTVTVTATGNGDPLLADGSLGSGVDPSSILAPQTFTTSGSHVASARIADVAGHPSATTRLTVKVDADPPATTLVCPTADVALGARATARWTDRDGQSGLAAAATGTLVLDTSALGTHTVEHTASDHVGHAATSSCDYHVVFGYRAAGSTRAPPTFNAVARAPSPTLVTFTLTGNRGLAVFTPGYPQVQPVSCIDGTPSGSPAAAQAAAPLAYAAGTDRYTYSWSTSAVAAGSCVALELGFVDGTVHEAWFRR
ncbi:MAG TPA: PxKF domain-containing protein, partial [Conexibacter sp.]|nr:PxKF domain-containing protein [Conexibacter sp.]